MALNCNGDNLSVPNHDNDDITFCTWIKRSVIAGTHIIMISVANNGWGVGFHASQTQNILFTKVGVNGSYSTGNQFNSTTDWVHLAVVLDNTADTLRFFKNGVFINENAYSSTFNNGGGIYSIAGRGASEQINARLADMRVYYSALSDEEIGSLANAGGKDGITGAQSRWLMDEETTGTAVTQIIDVSGNGNDSSAVGGNPTYIEAPLSLVRY